MSGRPSKYRKSIADRICELIRSDTYTIREICKTVNIGIETYYEWKKAFPEFSESIKRALDERDLKFVNEARKSLLKKLTGYRETEEKTTYVISQDGTPTVKERTEQAKYFQPDTVAIIFTLCNKDGWTNKYAAEVSGKGGENLFQDVAIQKTYPPNKVVVEFVDFSDRKKRFSKFQRMITFVPEIDANCIGLKFIKHLVRLSAFFIIL
jgi:hypothetical protein